MWRSPRVVMAISLSFTLINDTRHMHEPQEESAHTDTKKRCREEGQGQSLALHIDTLNRIDNFSWLSLTTIPFASGDQPTCWKKSHVCVDRYPEDFIWKAAALKMLLFISEARERQIMWKQQQRKPKHASDVMLQMRIAFSLKSDKGGYSIIPLVVQLSAKCLKAKAYFKNRWK